MQKKAADAGATVTRATAFNFLHTGFLRHSSGVTPTLTRRCPRHRATASCTLHSDDLKALSWLPSRRAGQWFCLNTSRLGDEGTQVLTCLHTYAS